MKEKGGGAYLSFCFCGRMVLRLIKVQRIEDFVYYQERARGERGDSCHSYKKGI